MSTKIYSGFRTALSFRALDALIRDFSGKLQELQVDEIGRVVATHAAFDFDNRAAVALTGRSFKPTTGRFIPAYAQRAFLAQLDAERGKEPRDDDDSAIRMTSTAFTLCLYPKGRFIYGVPFGAQRGWGDAWAALPGIEEYGYWNNTDPPDGMKPREWARRKRTWDALVDWRFKDSAYTRELTAPLLLQPELKPRHMAAVVAGMPSYTERVWRIARDLCWTDWKAHRMPATLDPRNVFMVYSLFNDWLKTGEGAGARATAEGMVRECLTKNLTVDTLMGDA